MQSRTVAFRGHGGLALVGDAVGRAGDPPVLLLHGGGQTRHAWGSTARALAAAGWYVVSLDHRGRRGRGRGYGYRRRAGSACHFQAAPAALKPRLSARTQ